MGRAQPPVRRAWKAPLAPALLTALLAALLAAPAPAAAAHVEVLPDPPLRDPVPVAPGDVVERTWNVVNSGEANASVALHALAPEGWNATVLPRGFVAPPQAEGEVRSFTLTVAVPERAAAGVQRVRVVVSIAQEDRSESHEVALALEVTHNGLVLGRFANPLPAPLDNVYGVFLLDLAFWALVSLVFIAIQDPVVRFLARHGEKRVAARIAGLVRVPVFLLLVVVGLRNAWRVLPPGPLVDLGLRVLDTVIIFSVMYVAYRVVRAALLYYHQNLAERTSSELDDILVPVIEKLSAVVIGVLGLLYIASTFGVDLGAFVVGGTVASLVIAFAAQDSLSNFFSGLFLLADRPFAIGDEIMISTAAVAEGVYRVEHIGLRSTRLYHFRAHQTVVVPNNDLAQNPVINLSSPDRLYRVTVNVGVAYGSDVVLVQEIMLRAAKEHAEVVEEPKPVVTRLENFGESSLDFIVLFFITNARRRNYISSDVRLAILEGFRRAGVEIPFPQRVVHLPDVAEGRARVPMAPRTGLGAGDGAARAGVARQAPASSVATEPPPSAPDDRDRID